MKLSKSVGVKFVWCLCVQDLCGQNLYAWDFLIFFD